MRKNINEVVSPSFLIKLIAVIIAHAEVKFFKSKQMFNFLRKIRNSKVKEPNLAVPWLRRLVTGLSPRRPGFDPGSVHVGFVVDKVALGQAFLRVLRFSPVSLIPPVLHYTKNQKKLIIFITGSHNKSQSCGASVASAAGLFIEKGNPIPLHPRSCHNNYLRS
jgi:hypothetical protein